MANEIKSKKIPDGLYQLGLVISCALTLVAFEWQNNTLSFNITNHGSYSVPALPPEPTPLPPPPPKPQPPTEKPVSKSLPVIPNPAPPTGEINKTDDNEKADDYDFSDLDNQGIGNVIIDTSVRDIPPVVSTAFLEVPPYFLSYKKGRYEKRFEKSKADINTILDKNLRIPAMLAHESFTAKAKVAFLVDEFGNTSDIKVINEKTLDPALVQEAIRVISLLPKWSPGRVKGANVRTPFVINIVFKNQ